MDFKFYTGVLKAWTEGEGADQARYVTGTTSSTIRDLQGDEITLEALQSMRLAALNNMTIFLNHAYNVPNDLFGSVVDARIVKRDDAEAGEVYDLDITVKVCPEDENPDAQRTFRAIERGVKLGFSIGASVTKAKRVVKDGIETFVIQAVRLLEASVVGIPANQRSYLQNAVKALRGQGELPSEAGIPRDVEEKGKGDHMRAVRLKNDSAAEDRRKAAAEAEPITGEDIVGEAETTEAAADDAAAADAEQLAAEPVADGGTDDEPAAEADPEPVAGPVAEPEVEPAAAVVEPVVAPTPTDQSVALSALVGAVKSALVLVQKAGKRNAAADQESIDAIHDLTVDLGCAAHSGKAAPAPALVKTGWDASYAASALQSILLVLDREMDEPEQASALQDAIAALTRFINAEVTEPTPDYGEYGFYDAANVPVTKALEAAISVRKEVADLRKQVTALTDEKAQVEAALSKTVELLTTALALPRGRKSQVAGVAAKASEYPWLAPSIETWLNTSAPQS